MSKLISVFLAVSLSFLLFVGMTILIKPKALVIEDAATTVPISLKTVVKDTEPKKRNRIPPKPVPEPKPQTNKTIAETSKPNREVASFERVKFTKGAGLNVALLNTATSLDGRGDGDANPKIRINPAYPPEAARNGIEGFVTLTFDISEIGRPINVTVVEAKPRGMFEKNARRALKKWKYEPKIQDKKAVKQLNQRVTLSFELESDSI